jgi:hypothetical protein
VLLETVKMLLEALRDIRMFEEALIVLVQAVKMLVEAVRVLGQTMIVL